MHLMIDLETLATGPDATILTIAAQAFDPFGNGHYDRHYYARVTLESQENRSIEEGTLDWWATQPAVVRDEALDRSGRVPLDQALDELGRLIWQSRMIWAQGPTFDCTILEHAYKSSASPCPGNIRRFGTAAPCSACGQTSPSRLPPTMRWKTAADRSVCCREPCAIST